MTGFRILLVIIIAVFVASCVSIHTGQVGSVSSSNIADKDVVFKDVVFGYSHAHYFLGFGGNRKSVLTADALENLFQVKLLENGEYYDNVTYNSKFTFFPFFYSQKEVLVVAHLMQSDTIASRVYTKKFLNQININQQHNKFGFIPNENVIMVLANNIIQGKVIYVKKNNLRMVFKTNKGFYRVKKMKNKNIFKVDSIKINSRYSIGDTISIINRDDEITRAKIIGYNNEKVLTKIIQDGNLLSISRNNLD